MAYTPPLGNAINFEFVSGAYSPPPSDSIVFSFYEGGPPSERSILASGFDGSGLGQPTTFNKTRYILAGGKPSSVTFGQSLVFNRTRYLTNVTLGQTQGFGAATLSGGLRQLLVSGIAAPAIGYAWASHSPRFLSPASIGWNFHSSHTIGYNREVAPQGFDAARFGTRIIPESRTLHAQGFSAPVGEPGVTLGRRNLLAQGFKLHAAESLRYGVPLVWNWRQYRELQGFGEEVFGAWTKVENINRVVAHHSTAPAFLPSPSVENKARPLLPVGVPAPDPAPFQKVGDVSHKHRVVSPVQIDPPYIQRWANVSNNARVVRGVGYATQQFGVGLVWNNRRSLHKAGDFDASVFGDAFVAPAVRQITFDSRYGIAPPIIRLPDVRLNTRYLEQIGGTDMFRVGAHSLRIHWNIAYPRWTHQEHLRYGMPTVENKTPMLRQRGRDSQEFGDSAIRTQWREIVTLELFSQRFGKAKVSDRTITVFPVEIPPIRLSDKLTVAKLTADPPEAKHVIPLGIAPPMVNMGNNKWEQVPWPIAGAQSIRPLGIDPEDVPGLIGRPVVLYMGINNATVGSFVPNPEKPWVSHKHRRIDVAPPQDEPNRHKFDAYGKPRLSPLTVWAVVDAPEQAKANHPLPYNQALHLIDFVIAPIGQANYWKKGLGVPAVTQRLRSVHVSGSVFTGYGEHFLMNKLRRVETTGANYGVVGKPRILSFARTITQSNNNQPGYTEHLFGGFYGTPFVSNKERMLSPSPIASSNRFGVSQADFFNRFVKPQGLDALTVSSFSGQQNPYQWQRLRVGPLVPNQITGTDMAAFGTQWVSNRVRGVGAIGFDSFVSEETFEDFALRMRVRYHPVEHRPYRLISPQSFGAETIPHHHVGYRARYITPDGNMDNFRKGAPNA